MIASAYPSTAMGVRDRAIMLLMATTGMRACDVVTLTLDDIDWRANEIGVRQEKTGVALALPLDARAGEAIARYILDARRDYDGRAVFTTTMGASRPLAATSINHIVRKYSPAADAAGFDGVHGPHAFRRGLGSAMVNSVASLAEVAEVLGHSRAESAMPYASMATERKRLRTNDVQERTNRETRRRSRVVQVFPSVASLERLAGAAMCDQDEAWSDARYFSEKVMAELYEARRRRRPDEPPTADLRVQWRAVARKAIDASLELADELEAA